MSNDFCPPKPGKLSPLPEDLAGQVQRLMARVDRFGTNIDRSLSDLDKRIVQMAEYVAAIDPGIQAALATRVGALGDNLSGCVSQLGDLLCAKFNHAEAYSVQQYGAILDRLRLLEDDSAAHKLANRLAASVSELLDAHNQLACRVEETRSASPQPQPSRPDGTEAMRHALPGGYDIDARYTEDRNEYRWIHRTADCMYQYGDWLPSFGSAVDAATLHHGSDGVAAALLGTGLGRFSNECGILGGVTAPNDVPVTAAVTPIGGNGSELEVARRLLARAYAMLKSDSMIPPKLFIEFEREWRAWTKRTMRDR